MAAITPSAFKTGNYYNTSLHADATSLKPRFKVGYVTLAATADDGDTATLDIYDRFGMVKLMAIEGFIQTTANSVVVEEAPTTAVSGTSLTITVGGATDNKQRTYVIYGI